MKKVLWWFMAGTAVFPLVLGAVVTATGLEGMSLLFGTAVEAGANPTLDSNVRFLGANFLGMGIVIVWILGDLESRLSPLKIVFATILIGGISRAVSSALYGSPAAMATLLMCVEFAVPVIGMWMASRVAREQVAGA